MPAKPLDLEQFEGHTPGPWDRHAQFVRSNGNAIGEALHDTATKANATLMAAAPALLAECRRLQQSEARLREALLPLVAVEERKLASLEKRPYAVGIVTVRERLEKARAALKATES